VNLLIKIAMRHLFARKRQSLVSLMGIVLGVAFFLAVAALMRGSEADFIRRLVDNSPHITVQDEYRNARPQPAVMAFSEGAVEIHGVKPLTETRGVRGYQQILESLKTIDGLRASPVLAGQALISFAGRNVAISLNGVIPADMKIVSTIENYMVAGTIDRLIVNPDGIVIGDGLAKKLSLTMDRNITVVAPTGQVHAFKIVGMFHTGRSAYDETQAFVVLKRVQSLMDRANRVNTIVMKLSDAYQARAVAAEIEGRIGYKAVSWQEATEDIMSTLTIRNFIMYSVVSAVLIVAAFGIYNIISTVVMEKRRDIAILKSMGFRSADIQRIFLVQGLILGVAGSVLGLALGAVLMTGLIQIRVKYPGAAEAAQMPVDWGWPPFAIAAGFAMTASLFAAVLPARKGSRVQPMDILRGGA
jgi:lipoprotein-releasing system permease protein